MLPESLEVSQRHCMYQTLRVFCIARRTLIPALMGLLCEAMPSCCELLVVVRYIEGAKGRPGCGQAR
jgi:hypothetical protein